MKRLHIVAAIIFNAEKDKIFITKRAKEAHQGGLWEFPGGKVENNESAQQGLIRELYEEVGIVVTELSLFEHLNYDYPDKSLEFDFFTVTQFQHEPFGKEGQLGEWVKVKSLVDYEFPKANVPIVSKIIELSV